MELLVIGVVVHGQAKTQSALIEIEIKKKELNEFTSYPYQGQFLL